MGTVSEVSIQGFRELPPPPRRFHNGFEKTVVKSTCFLSTNVQKAQCFFEFRCLEAHANQSHDLQGPQVQTEGGVQGQQKAQNTA